MAVPQHGDASTAANLHRIGVIAASDPGAIGAGKAWIDSSTTPNTLYLRDDADAAWIGPFALVSDIDTSGLASLAGATFTGAVDVPDDPYDATGWNGNTGVPTKNAIRDKIESLGGGGDALTTDGLDQFAATTSAELAG